MPRVYRGRDIKWWMEVIGAMDVRYDEVDDLERARRLPSLQLIGRPERETIASALMSSSLASALISK